MVDGLGDLDGWLGPFLAVMGRKTRRAWAPLYVQGLLGPGERKSVQPMAERLGLGGHDQLQHFVASPAWDDGPLWTVLAREADRLVGGAGAYLVIDDTALPKQGRLANLPPRTSVRALAAAIKARWVCEQVHQQLKGELGLGHFEGRSWTGLHRHVLMACIAYTYLQHLRLAGQTRTGPGENAPPCSGTATRPEPARRATGRDRQAVRQARPTRPVPLLPAQVPSA